MTARATKTPSDSAILKIIRECDRLEALRPTHPEFGSRRPWGMVRRSTGLTAFPAPAESTSNWVESVRSLRNYLVRQLSRSYATVDGLITSLDRVVKGMARVAPSEDIVDGQAMLVFHADKKLTQAVDELKQRLFLVRQSIRSRELEGGKVAEIADALRTIEESLRLMFANNDDSKRLVWWFDLVGSDAPTVCEQFKTAQRTLSKAKGKRTVRRKMRPNQARDRYTLKYHQTHPDLNAFDIAVHVDEYIEANDLKWNSFGCDTKPRESVMQGVRTAWLRASQS